MRKQVRPGAPEEFDLNSKRWSEQWAQRKAINPAAAFSWYQHNNKSAREYVLPILRLMNQGHCSFCDAFPIEDRSKEPIEHFRPKSTFHDEAYDWSNLFYCCDACQSNKGERWDDRLLRPDFDDYIFSRYFEYDFISGEFRPSFVATEVDRDCAAVTIKIFSLDDPVRRRYRMLEMRKWISSDGGDIDDYAYRDFLETSGSSAV